MKYVCLIFILASVLAHADPEKCGADLLQDGKAQKAIAFLQPLVGDYEVDKCKVELNVCSGPKAEDPQDTVIGDLLVTDKFGQQFYFLLNVSDADTEKTSHTMEIEPRRLHYESIERIPDSQNGRTEAYRLDIDKTKDHAHMLDLVLGTYTSTLKAKYPFLPKAKSYWVDCH